MIVLQKILACIIILALVEAQPCNPMSKMRAQISGTVYMDGAPITGTVLLKNDQHAIIAQERTNGGGHFIIKDLDPGTYYLSYLNLQGSPWGGELMIQVRIGRFEQVDLHLSSADRENFAE